jgi:RHS repeat-associated protein
VRCVQGICQTVTTSYDALGRVASVTYPDCDKITYHYDEAGRQYSADGFATLQYDSRGHVHTITNTNGTQQTYTYDGGRAWLTSSTVTSGATTLYQASYNYNLGARVDSISSTTNPLMALSFVYDDLNRLKTVSGGQSQSLTYDVLGNILTNSDYGTYQYADPNHVHAVTSIGSDTFTYDGNGNMRTAPGRTMTWDAENRMSSITQNGVTTTFAYDPSGQRIRKGSTYYYGPAERQADGTLAKYFTVGGLLIAKKDSGGTYWYHSDHLGSPRLLTTSSGATAASYDYSAFGKTVAQGANNIANPVGFDAQRADAESGLVYMNARYYDPKLARFLSADSVVPSASNPQALNRYSFVYNNPISNTDPSGHVPVAAAWIGIAIAYDAGFTTMAVIGIAGALATTAGYITHNDSLMLVGEMLTAAFNGPVATFGWGFMKQIEYSHLSPGVKTAIGWAWTAASMAYSFSQQAAKDPSTPADAPIVEDKGYKGAETAVFSPEEAWCRSTPVAVTHTSAMLAGKEGAEANALADPEEIKLWDIPGTQGVVTRSGDFSIKITLLNPEESIPVWKFKDPLALSIGLGVGRESAKLGLASGLLMGFPEARLLARLAEGFEWGVFGTAFMGGFGFFAGYVGTGMGEGMADLILQMHPNCGVIGNCPNWGLGKR